MTERALAARATAAVVATVRSVTAQPGDGGAIVTVVVLDPEHVVLGALPRGPITLHERGGRSGQTAERIFGSPDYRVGERVLAFVSRDSGGALRTTGMAMGKYRLETDASGAAVARRVFEEGVTVLDPVSGRVRPGGKLETASLTALFARLGIAAPALAMPVPRAASSHRLAPPVQQFTYLSQPSRWFEPDDGLPVHFAIDPGGAHGVGAGASAVAAWDALAAWSEAGSALRLGDSVLSEARPFAGCEGGNRVVFDDPFDEIDDPVDCSGVLGIGGFCFSGETRSVNGTTFNRIGLGKVTLANGWEQCAIWTPCNVAEVLTHELGHAVGIGHSEDNQATMWPAARFDERCANLAHDDFAAVRSMYPIVATATATRTFTRLPSPTPTPTRQRTSTPRRTPTPGLDGRSGVSGRIRYYAGDAPVPGAMVTMHGDRALVRTSTLANGQYLLAEIPDGRWTLEPSLDGSTDRAVSALDAAWILQTRAGLRTMNDMQRTSCDVTAGGTLGAADAARILEYVVGDLDRLPAAAGCRSDWLFMPVAQPTPGQTMAMPELDAGTCTRGAVRLDPLQGMARGQDLHGAVIGDCTGNWGPGVAELAAPAGTSIELQPLRRRPGGRWLQPIAVRAPADAHALELELRYDATQLELGGVRAINVREPSVLRSRSSQPGRLAIAIASAHPLPNDGRPVVIVEFSATARDISPRLVRPFTATVDERVVISR